MEKYSLVKVIATVFILLCLIVFVPSTVQYQLDVSNCHGKIDGNELEQKGDYWDHFYGREVCYVHYNDTYIPIKEVLIMKCVVLDYVNGECFIFSLDKIQEQEIEDILTERYEYRLKDIEYTVVEGDKFKINLKKGYNLEGLQN